MFDVQGYADGVAYTVRVDTANVDSGNPDASPIAGSPIVRSILAEREGEIVTVSPVGPYLELDLTDETSILGALMAWTDVTQVEGDAPEVFPPDVAGAVY